ncbi:MAG: hypothetical protein ACRC5T_10030 [Cetobacterium sp.]
MKLIEMIASYIEKIDSSELEMYMEHRELEYQCDYAEEIIMWRHQNDNIDDIYEYEIEDLAKGIYECEGMFYFFSYVSGR